MEYSVTVPAVVVRDLVFVRKIYGSAGRELTETGPVGQSLVSCFKLRDEVVVSRRNSGVPVAEAGVDVNPSHVLRG